MKINKIYKTIILILCCLICLYSVVACAPERGEGEFEDNNLSYSNYVFNVKMIETIVGEANIRNNTNQYRVNGTDLGFPIYNPSNNTMYLAFGDTFSTAMPGGGAWRSNVLASSTDFNLSDGLDIDGFYSGATGIAKAVIEGKHITNTEVTKIPTGGIYVNGAFYMFYMSIREWDNWTVNYCGAVKSTDNCKSFVRVNDLSWVNTDTGIIATDTLDMINCDIDGVPLQANDVNRVTTLSGRVAPNFGQIFPVDGKDGYIYIYGIPGGRSGNVKMGRVKSENIEDFDEYEYFVGLTEDNQPKYVKGATGLQIIRNGSAGIVVDAPCAELSIAYNTRLKKFVMVYLKYPNLIFRLSDNMYTWSRAETIITATEYPNLYGGLINEHYMSADGKKIYFIMSQWTKSLYTSHLFEMELN